MLEETEADPRDKPSFGKHVSDNDRPPTESSLLLLNKQQLLLIFHPLQPLYVQARHNSN